MENKTILVLVLFISLFVFPASGHKPIPSADDNTTLENAMMIMEHKKSWVIFETLEPYQEKFYAIPAESGDSFYSEIVIPKIDRLESYSPTLGLIYEKEIDLELDIKTNLIQNGLIFQYEGEFPSNEFYEPFGQATYWERQKVMLNLPHDGIYYLVLYDQQGQKGKISLAIGTIEDFSFVDFFTILPLAWIETKIFFEDFVSIVIMLGLPSVVIAFIIIRNIRK